jgi:hypothetical protein
MYAITNRCYNEQSSGTNYIPCSISHHISICLCVRYRIFYMRTVYDFLVFKFMIGCYQVSRRFPSSSVTKTQNALLCNFWTIFDEPSPDTKYFNYSTIFRTLQNLSRWFFSKFIHITYKQLEIKTRIAPESFIATNRFKCHKSEYEKK